MELWQKLSSPMQRVSFERIRNIAIYLKEKKHPITIFYSTTTDRVIVEEPKITRYFEELHQVYDYLLPIVEEEEQRDFAEYVRSRGIKL